MLFNCAQDKAVQYLSETMDQVSTMGEIIQLIVVELIRKVCRTNPQDRVSPYPSISLSPSRALIIVIYSNM